MKAVKRTAGSGAPLPSVFYNAPSPRNEYEAAVVAAFDELATCRAVGFSAGPIPWNAVDAYAVRYGYADDEVLYQDFVTHIRVLDEVWIEFRMEEQKREDKQHGKSGAVPAAAGGARPKRGARR